MRIKSDFSVLFEAPFWVGIYERYYFGQYEVCKITFGAEPKDCEVYEFFSENWSRFKFSPPVKTKIDERKINPKRIKREISNSLQSGGIGTKAQRALKLQHEQNKLERKKKAANKSKPKKPSVMPCGAKRKNSAVSVSEANFVQKQTF